jgi:hypothetical protein
MGFIGYSQFNKKGNILTLLLSQAPRFDSAQRSQYVLEMIELTILLGLMLDPGRSLQGRQGRAGWEWKVNRVNRSGSGFCGGACRIGSGCRGGG